MIVRRVLTPALHGLRAWWGTAVLLAAATAAALAVLLPAASLVGRGAGTLPSRLAVAPAGGMDLELVWGALARSPDAIRAAAVASLSHLLIGIAAGVVAVTWLTALALSTARASARAGETVIRRAVGASRWQILGASLLEGGFVAAAALVVGGATGLAAARAALGLWPGTVGPAAPVAGAAAVAATLAGLAIGALLPLAFARRDAALVNAEEASLALAVPAVQLGLSLTVLVAGSLLGARARAPAGAAAAPRDGQVYELTALDRAPEARAAAYAALLRRLAGEPSVEAASLTSRGATVGLGPEDVVASDCGNCRWGGLPLPWHTFFAIHHLVSADSFRALGLRVVAGRALSDADGWGAPRVAVVSRSLANLHFEPNGAVGRAIRVGHGSDELYTVVGVVADRAPAGFGGGSEPPDVVYLSVLQHPAAAVELLVRPRVPGAAGAAVARALHGALGPRLAGLTRTTEAGLLAAEAAPLGWFGRLLGAVGGAMVAVATLGAFAVMWLWVASLLRELGVRRAVGARRRDLLAFVLWRAAFVAAAGVAFGLWVGTMAWDALGAVVAGLPAWDPHAVLRYGALLVAATLAGALVPALQASRRSPVGLLGAS